MKFLLFPGFIVVLFYVEYNVSQSTELPPEVKKCKRQQILDELGFVGRNLVSLTRDELLIGFTELITKYATAQERTLKILAIVAPAYLRKYIEETEKRLLSRCFLKVNDYNSMLNVLKVNNETITKKTRQLLERVADEKEYGLKDSLEEKLSYHYVAWKYILTSANPENKDIKQLKHLMNLLGVSEETFAAEISFLWVKSSIFGVHDISESSAINLDTLFEGLRFYKISFPTTRVVVEVLFKLVTS